MLKNGYILIRKKYLTSIVKRFETDYDKKCTISADSNVKLGQRNNGRCRIPYREAVSSMYV